MILGIGIDLVELNRIKELINERFINRILSLEEQLIYKGITNDKVKLSFVGGRFAAKEAIFKAISKGDGSANYTDFSILNDENGKPYVSSKYIENKTIHITITHTDAYAMSYCVIEQN
ncbi:holo-ACP synthase [Mariniplasma anaerobium]|uniref:Holo-[acyl-carrier-protein] synthase n=1 Tax=Mariniplasma anaerobium TaxID=2735436 RepID=A0A7U9TK88_9MOLU|nr:holo-ACP synthase [Mariniplasma anaerobium]BCR35168.1 holo-[acyl-carrier-protein] synthase [Mariniplasma anaerobium]